MDPSVPAPVFVTGAGGLIGSAICRELASKGIQAKALLAPDEPLINLQGLNGIEIIRGDVRDSKAMHAAANGCGSLIHCAAINSLWHREPQELYSVNVEGTKTACRAAKAAGTARFVFTSSCEVTGPAMPGAPADESQALGRGRVRGHYELSKLRAEEEVRRHLLDGLPAVVLRPTAVLGAGDIHCTPLCMLIRAFIERRIPAYYDAGINVVGVSEVAKAHVAALTKGKPGEVYILGGHNIWLSQLFAEIEQASGIQAPTRRLGYRTALAIAVARCLKAKISRSHPLVTISGLRTVRYPWFFGSSKAEQGLAFAVQPLDEIVRDAVAWHLKNCLSLQGH